MGQGSSRIRAVVSALAVLLLIAQGISPSDQTSFKSRRQMKCGSYEWYDENVNDCAPCQELCDHRKITGTERECEQKCPDYLKAKSCTEDEYYDENVGSCGSCEELCTHSDITRTADDCQIRCNVYLMRRNKHPTSNNKDDRLELDVDKQVGSPDEPALSKTHIAVIVVGILVAAGVACGLAAFFVKKGRCKRGYQQTTTEEREEIKTPVQAEEKDIGIQVF